MPALGTGSLACSLTPLSPPPTHSWAFSAEELKNPQRDLPLGILGSLAACAGLYMALAAVVTGLVPASQLSAETPISSAFAAHGVAWVARLVSGGALAALSTTLMGSLLPQPRVLMAMARDGLLPGGPTVD